MEIMIIITQVSFLIEVSVRIDGIIHASNTLADIVCFDSIDVEGNSYSPTPQPLKDSMQALQER